MGFSSEQTKAIEEAENVVVTAGAGSGKTTVLAQRFFYLITARGLKVNEILTLTFTKKAATEMSTRIYKTLLESGDPKAREARDDFFKAEIRTIDSYCASIARAGVQSYGIASNFSIDEDRIVRDVKKMAETFVLSKREGAAAATLSNLLGTRDYSNAAEVFFDAALYHASIVHPFPYVESLKRQRNEVTTLWQKMIKEADRLIGEIKDLMEGDGCKKGGAIYNGLAAAFSDHTPLAPGEFGEDFFCDISRPGDLVFLLNESALYRAAKVYLTFIYRVSYVKLTSEKALVKAPINELKKTFLTLTSLLNWVATYPVMVGLLPLLCEFESAVSDYKRATGVLTYRDVADLALDILINNESVRTAQKKKFRAIMIDEFQDNNDSQKDLLFLLAEREDLPFLKRVPAVSDLVSDKLFFVGDEKQSIYRFRGADVSCFKTLSCEIKKTITLSDNYRSSERLIASFNEIFGGERAAFYTEKNKEGAKDFDAIYHDVTVPQNKKDTEPMAENPTPSLFALTPPIHFNFIKKKKRGEKIDPTLPSNEEREARWVGEKILSLIDSGVDPNDIAVLFRKYSSQPLFERVFLTLGVPYDTAQVTGFFCDGVVADFFAPLYLSIYPNSRYYLAQYLTGPLVGLSLKEAAGFLSGGKRNKEIDLALDFISRLRAWTTEHTITEVLSFLWCECALRYTTIWSKKLTIYRKLFDLLFEAGRRAESNAMSLASFIDELSRYRAKRLDDMDIPLPTKGGVKILSIHKAKGLEWKKVFVVASGAPGAARKNSDIFYFNNDYGLTLNLSQDIYPLGRVVKEGGVTNYFFNKEKEMEAAQDEAELRRVTYVALTRAKDEVYITASNFDDKANPADYLTDRPQGDERKRVITIADVIRPSLALFEATKKDTFALIECNEIKDDEGSKENKRRGHIAGDKKPHESKPAVIKRMEGVFNRARPYSKKEESTWVLRLASKEGMSGESFAEYKEKTKGSDTKITNSPSKVKGDYDAATFGTIIHKTFEAAVKGEAYSPDQFLVDALSKNIKIRDALLEECRGYRDKFLSSEIFNKIKSATYFEAEYPFIMKVEEGVLEKGVIDLFYKDEHGDFYIVDYKTDRIIDSVQHKSQLEVYQKAIEEIFCLPREAVHAYLYYVRFDKVVDSGL